MSTSSPAAEQPSLFGGDALALDAGFGTAVRHELDERSWLEFVPGWLAGSQVLFDRLRSAVPFEHHKRWMYNQLFDEPRLTTSYPDIATAPDPFLRTIAAALSRRYGVDYDGLWLNLYRSESDSTGWHGDPIRKGADTIVPVLSLGSTRRFLIKPKDGGASRIFTPVSGDLVVMGGQCQHDWRHSVPKQSQPAAARISVNFQSSTQLPPARGTQQK